MAVTYAGGAAGTESYVVALRNTGPGPCQLHDYPGVSFTDAAGHLLLPTAARQPPLRAAFTIAPDQYASTTVTVTSGACGQSPPRAVSVGVIPPDQTTPLSAHISPNGLGEAPPVIVCNPDVYALAPGRNGSYPP